jgi:hypothetical protein
VKLKRKVTRCISMTSTRLITTSGVYDFHCNSWYDISENLITDHELISNLNELLHIDVIAGGYSLDLSVGDTVKIINDIHECNDWVIGMNEYIGLTTTIRSIDYERDHIFLDIDNGFWTWDSSYLEKIS